MIGFVIAMECEAMPLIDIMEAEEKFVLAGKSCYRGKILGCDAAIIVCGIGKVNAAMATQALIMHFPVKVIINIGVAGAVNPELNICDICVAERAIQYDFDITAIDDVPVGYIQDIDKQYIYSDNEIFKMLVDIFGISVTVATADRFSTKSSEAEFIASLGSDLRDMELGAIAQVCYINQIPFASLKTISDTAKGCPSQEFKVNLEKSVKCLPDNMHKIIDALKTVKGLL